MRRNPFIAMLAAACSLPVTPKEAHEIKGEHELLPPIAGVPLWSRPRAIGIPFYGRTIGTRKAMRAANKRRRIHARASKRKGGAL
jgi:hypothetical protein